MTDQNDGNDRSKFDPRVMDSGCYLRVSARTPGRDDDRANFGLDDEPEIELDDEKPLPLDALLK